MDEVESKIIDIIAKDLNIDKSKITPQSRLVEDLGIDSLGQVEIVMAIDATFGIDTNDEESTKISTIADAVALVKQKVAALK
ncbi:MAG: acyl carrier protein [Rickettsiaceae bacterium]|nr:acyl carrier protein [Rickettsiaceae bacterium]